uniref:Uncharacterized protein n=1 Tax=Lepeophtheirus salmonis TaxID=72036 RepID=A0A0K2TG32_LEPSM|nr:uncharacterized protein LOC121115103 [Lepeophtheirus salmonis]
MIFVLKYIHIFHYATASRLNMEFIKIYYNICNLFLSTMTAFQSLARSPRIKYMKDCYGRNEWATWNPPNIKFGIYAFLLIFVQIIYFVRLSVKGRSVRRQMNTNRGPMVVKNDSFISIHIMKDVGYSITFAILCICCPMSGILLSPTNCVGLSTVTHWIYALAVTIFIIPMYYKNKILQNKVLKVLGMKNKRVLK